MRRQNKKIDLQGLKKQLDSDSSSPPKWESYSCTLVTPMYGGGVQAGEIDKDMPIRASAIRGQLRFWWRIACGPKDPKELFEKETEIWGGIGDGAKASQVEIRVTANHPINQTSSEEIVTKKDKQGRGITYILGAGDPAKCLDSGFKFKISIRYHLRSNSSNPLSIDSLKVNVAQALNWWATFGGVGAKTRRGFGAVEVDGLCPIPITDFDDEMSSKGCKFALAEVEATTDAQYAWKVATLRLQQFRHGKELGRNTGKTITTKHGKKIVLPGRSRWPEPDQLRRFTGDCKLNHDPEHPAGNAFPRAAFGMPIIFDFNDDTNTEPKTMTLLPVDYKRMASPLIIRPYKSGGQWKAAALLLPNWKEALVEPLELRLSSNNEKVTYQVNHWPDEDQQVERDRLTNDIKPMKGRANDPLSAFLEYFKEGHS
ncbi:type III-B CRISPR module RAMP protein Cmr1 [Pseudoalteromonas tunicata]|uniref:type III-B CRISPR module RAMP protein Cmr1 n=1 Tax=Pseudoalteromonas tunicata TaxID=314281 RepID=UPI00273FE99D|nr:type III-B CRISPR module RAMP protein Cmr1 [Pseudoalteromonas tunicata]MDP5213951.1 type III-B CRISPR module RAMP protein Cmr1 [Pseudoalteromonas tunicata]